jgi:hypothetical protein
VVIGAQPVVLRHVGMSSLVTRRHLILSNYCRAGIHDVISAAMKSSGGVTRLWCAPVLPRYSIVKKGELC